jgi:glutamine synthetase
MAGKLDVKTLEGMVSAGEVDTVLCVFPDLQGRFVGKRVTPSYFFKDILGAEGLHACEYLLTVDIQTEVMPGYEFASWDTGYGDFSMVPDLSTLCLVPWIPKTALVICDLVDEETGEPIEVSPRQILKRQIQRAHEAGFTAKMASELEFYLFNDSYRELADRGYRDPQPSSTYMMDYHILQTTRDEPIVRQIRNDMLAAGIPIEFSKGETGFGQHEINITYADALAAADMHSIYKHGVREIADANGVSITFMAKYSMAHAGSSSHIHSSLWTEDGSDSVMWDASRPHNMSATFEHYLAGLLTASRELTLMYAPFVNSYKRYQLGSWAPTAIVWGGDNRTVGYRLVGHKKGYRVENRTPGADANAYLAFAATIAAGLYGIEHKLELPPRFEGNAYVAEGVPRVPYSLHEAIHEFENSKIVPEMFGESVYRHLLNAARQEQSIFDNNVVTDWELARYFEQV